MVSALFRWPFLRWRRSISLNLSPLVSPFSVDHVVFLFICFPGLSLVVCALCCWPYSNSIHLSTRFVRPWRWPCSISMRLSLRSVNGGVRPFPVATFLFIYLPGLSLVVSALFCWTYIYIYFYAFVSQFFEWWPPFSGGHVAFLFICLPGLSLLVSALFRWRCTISIHLSSRSVTAGVRPFPLAHFCLFVFQVCH